ncbi:MAG: hypothetical protein NTW32_21395 [Chloroflexi bacterium]|nr:hypothetical protein [Chloroflexota bacterium]
MKVEISDTFHFPPEIIFAVLTDIRCHSDWLSGTIELASLSEHPARLGTKWEHFSDLLGRRVLISNKCNLYKTNSKFGWVTIKPLAFQTTFFLQPGSDSTGLGCGMEWESTGVAHMAEPLLVKETSERVAKSLAGMKTYLLTYTKPTK